jgi:antitoxin ParD1/3/4
MPTMNVSLTAEMVKFVEDEVASGDYVSASEVVRDALRTLKYDRDVEARELEILRSEIAKGIEDADNGRFSNRSADDIFEDVVRKHRR